MRTYKNKFYQIAMLLSVGVFAFTGCSDDTTVTPDDNTEELGGSIGTRTLDPDVVYIIDRFAYVDDGDILTILPGTILKANTGDGADASALIIARGGKIIANGTASKPIIFTSVDDDIKPGETVSTLSPASDAGKWGGLIILGRAPISASVSDGDTEAAVEGVPDVFSFSRYGGDNTNDDSGELSFVSIRFTGTTLASNEEIQGLTLGGVGAGTDIRNIEIISSDDDGIEFFGGSVSLSDILIAYQTDDGLDIDQSYRGTISNATVLEYNPSPGNDASEIDGPEGPSNANGKFTITNTTYINKSGTSRMAHLKSGAQGTLDNCSWRGFATGIQVTGSSANAHFASGDLKVTNSEFVGWAGTLAEVLTSKLTDGEENPVEDAAYEAVNDPLFTVPTAGNAVVATATKGSTADYSWTFAASLGLLD